MFVIRLLIGVSVVVLLVAAEKIELKCLQDVEQGGYKCDYENIHSTENTTFNISTTSRSYILNIAFHNSSLYKIPAIVFEIFYNSLTADFTNCGISVLTAQELKSTQKLVQLNLQKNKLTKIGAVLFKENVLAELNLQENAIENINVTAFENLHTLRILWLGRNKLRMLEKDIFESLVNLEEIDLSFNQLKYVHAELFKQNRKLETIHLNDNKILSIASAFNYCENLKVLNISANKLKQIDLTAATIDTLILNNNELESLHLNKFLVKLIAIDNKIKTLTCDPDLRGLRNVDLRRNQFSEIFCVARMSGLTSLNLSGNQIGLRGEIGGLKPGLFDNLISLQHLDISYNRLLSVDMSAFTTLYHLESLNLDGNNLSALVLSDSFFYKMLHLRTLTFNDNQLECSNVREIINYLAEHTIAYLSPYHSNNNKQTGVEYIDNIDCVRNETSTTSNFRTITRRPSAAITKPTARVSDVLAQPSISRTDGEVNQSSDNSESHTIIYILLIGQNIVVLCVVAYCIKTKIYVKWARERTQDEVEFL